MTVSKYIAKLQSYEEYSFSWDELKHHCTQSDTALKREISRLVEKKKILNLRQGFYLIIPPRYSLQGQLPIELYVDKLFHSLSTQYYLGLYSAAKFHGASHQQIQRDYVITSKQLFTNTNKKSSVLQFISAANWPPENILEKKSDAGIFKISSPALTIVDMIHHQRKLGGLNRMLAVIEELSDELRKDDLNTLLTWYPYKATLQRFGFVLEHCQIGEHLQDLVFEHLSSHRIFPVLLSPKSVQKTGQANNRWKVSVNMKLESDL